MGKSDATSKETNIKLEKTYGYLIKLLEENYVGDQEIAEYVNLERLFMKQNCFQYNNWF